VRGTQPSKSTNNERKGNELLSGSFFVLELSIIVFPPQAAQKATRNHLPHDRTSRATTHPPNFSLLGKKKKKNRYFFLLFFLRFGTFLDF